jgi:hypothetical protein
MVKVVLDIPKDKMHRFMQMVVGLGIEKNTIQSSIGNTIFKSPLERVLLPQKYPGETFLLFDWEFYCNELEYE